MRASWKDVYQPTPSRGGRRILLSHAEKFDLDAVFGDVRTAFLHVPKGSGPRLFMRPPRTEGVAEDVLWESGQMVYGFQESPRAWGEFLAEVLQSFGWRRLMSDPQLYVKFLHKKGERQSWQSTALISVHTDDFMMVVSYKWRLQVQDQINSKLRMEWSEPLGPEWTRYLGGELRRLPEGIDTRLPEQYFKNVLNDAGMADCRPTKTTGATGATAARNIRVFPSL